MSRVKEKIKEIIKEIISKYGKNENDSGSPEVQIAILTEEVLNITEHLKKNKQDRHSKRALILKLAHRKKLLNYLKKKSISRYNKIVNLLNL